jgi:hypothetical protein
VVLYTAQYTFGSNAVIIYYPFHSIHVGVHSVSLGLSIVWWWIGLNQSESEVSENDSIMANRFKLWLVYESLESLGRVLRSC